MLKFAVIAEGVTDQVVIERLISTLIEKGHEKDVIVTILQPLPDETDKARQAVDSFGGFENVLSYCADLAKISDALQFNHYLVIQIDTDMCEHPSFGLKLYKNEQEVDTASLISDVQNVIIDRLTPEFYAQFEHRIIFAVSVHSTECWLLPFFSNEINESHTKSCEDRLVRLLAKQNIPYKKDGPGYKKLCDSMKKLKIVRDKSTHCTSLSDFIRALENKSPFEVEL